MRALKFSFVLLIITVFSLAFTTTTKADPALMNGTASNATESVSFQVPQPTTLVWKSNTLTYDPISFWYTGEGMDELAVRFTNNNGNWTCTQRTHTTGNP